MKNRRLLLYFLFLLVSFTFGCENDDDNLLYPNRDFISRGTYEGVYWPTQEWRSCNPEEVGMDSDLLKELNEEVNLLMELHFNINSIIIVKDGYIVAEQYYSEDYGVDSLHNIYSCTKSLTSAMIGQAIEMGYISGIDAPMTDFFLDYEVENLTEQKQQITLEHMLTMSAGFEWYEIDYPYGDDRNTFRQWGESDDRVKFLLDLPMIANPGEEYSYNTGISHALSAIIKESTGIRADSFALEHLFSPLGIEKYYWPIDKQGVAYGGHGVRMLPRDMAKFGYLYLMNGAWDGKQIVPAQWVQTSQQEHIERKYIPDDYYGYQWWVSEDGYYSAVGFGGQWIMIVPEHDLVVVFTNHLTNDDEIQRTTPERLLTTYILPAL